MIIGELLSLAGNGKELFSGDLGALQQAADRLTYLGRHAATTAQGMREITDTSHWSGPASEEFRRYFQAKPPAWDTAAQAFSDAGTALSIWATELGEAQRKGEDLVARYRAAQATYDDAKTEFDDAVHVFDIRALAANGGNGVPPGPKPAMSTAGIRAQVAMDEMMQDWLQLKAALQGVADTTASTVRTATNLAPPAPSVAERVFDNATDFYKTSLQHFGDALGAVGDTAEGVLKSARITMAPFDPWALTHTSQATTNFGAYAKGLLHMVAHPVQTGENLIASHDWATGHYGAAIGKIGSTLIPGAGAAGKIGGGLLRRSMEDAADGVTRGLNHHIEPPTGPIDLGGGRSPHWNGRAHPTPEFGPQGHHPGDFGPQGNGHGGAVSRHDPGPHQGPEPQDYDPGPQHYKPGPQHHGPQHDDPGPQHHGPQHDDPGPQHHGPQHDDPGPQHHGPGGHHEPAAHVDRGDAPESLSPLEHSIREGRAVEHVQQQHPWLHQDEIRALNRFTRLTSDGHYYYPNGEPDYMKLVQWTPEREFEYQLWNMKHGTGWGD